MQVIGKGSATAAAVEEEGDVLPSAATHVAKQRLVAALYSKHLTSAFVPAAVQLRQMLVVRLWLVPDEAHPTCYSCMAIFNGPIGHVPKTLGITVECNLKLYATNQLLSSRKTALHVTVRLAKCKKQGCLLESVTGGGKRGS